MLDTSTQIRPRGAETQKKDELTRMVGMGVATGKGWEWQKEKKRKYQWTWNLNMKVID